LIEYCVHGQSVYKNGLDPPIAISSGAGSGMAGMAAAIPIWNLVWWRHTNLLKFGHLISRKNI